MSRFRIRVWVSLFRKFFAEVRVGSGRERGVGRFGFFGCVFSCGLGLVGFRVLVFREILRATFFSGFR